MRNTPLSLRLSTLGAGFITVALLSSCGSPSQPTAPTANPSGTAAPATAHSTPGATQAAGGSACLVGSWTATGETQGATNIGGAGQTYVFEADGTATQSYAGSAPLDGHTYAGIATATYILHPSDPAAPSGTITLTYVAGTVTITINGVTTKVPLHPATFNWTCRSDNAALSVDEPLGTVTVSLTRTSG